jgi:protein-S-isoprenylcysteine O-methyltransferase Ste14
MEFIPVFEIGIWNAWILTVALFLLIMLSGRFPESVAERIEPAEEVKQKNGPMMLVFFSLLIYSIFLPLKLGTAWFYTGLAVYLLGIAISLLALASVAATRPGEPFSTGIYRYSRHPISLGTWLPLIGIGIASASWLFLLLAVALAIIANYIATIEEAATARKFGDAYRDYIARTPKWLGLPRTGGGGEK